MDPLAYNEVRSRPTLEERLESIISAAALMADADCTRDERRERIVAECNAVRQALQDLLSAYMSNVSVLSSVCRTVDHFHKICHFNYDCLKLIMPNSILDGSKGEKFHFRYGYKSNVPKDSRFASAIAQSCGRSCVGFIFGNHYPIVRTNRCGQRWQRKES